MTIALITVVSFVMKRRNFRAPSKSTSFKTGIDFESWKHESVNTSKLVQAIIPIPEDFGAFRDEHPKLTEKAERLLRVRKCCERCKNTTGLVLVFFGSYAQRPLHGWPDSDVELLCLNCSPLDLSVSEKDDESSVVYRDAEEVRLEEEERSARYQQDFKEFNDKVLAKMKRLRPSETHKTPIDAKNISMTGDWKPPVD